MSSPSSPSSPSPSSSPACSERISWSDPSSTPCVLPQGHTGAHRGRTGISWTHNKSAHEWFARQELNRQNQQKPCRARISLSTLSNIECELDENHEGTHRFKSIIWNFDAREPITEPGE
ncbi:MAG TPA: hypothetical protein VGE97_02270 [Nitrososphaera sp.]